MESRKKIQDLIQQTEELQHDQSYGKDLEANNPDQRRGQLGSRKTFPGIKSTSDYINGVSAKTLP